MKVILTILLVLVGCVGMQSQELNGYFMREGIYSQEDGAYIDNNISGNSITIKFFNSELTSTKIIRIGHKTSLGTTYHDYNIVAAETATTKEDYNIVVANDKFGGDIAFKYNSEDFVLLYGYNEKLEKWTGFYTGMLLNMDIISFLSTKNLSN